MCDVFKLREHCHIGHNCTIEDHCLLVAYTRMAGSCTIRRGAILGADVRVRDHVEIGEGAILGASTGVTRDVEPGQKLWGMPGRPLRKQQRIYAIEGRLPDIHRRMRQLEKQVEQLQERQGDRE